MAAQISVEGSRLPLPSVTPWRRRQAKRPRLGMFTEFPLSRPLGPASPSHPKGGDTGEISRPRISPWVGRHILGPEHSDTVTLAKALPSPFCGLGHQGTDSAQVKVRLPLQMAQLSTSSYDPVLANTNPATPPPCPPQLFLLKLLLPCHFHAQELHQLPAAHMRSPHPPA